MSSPPRPAKQQAVPDRPHKATGAAAPMAPPRNQHNKNLFAAAPAPEHPVGAMKNLNIGKKMAHGGTITGPVLRRPAHHGMAGPTSFQPHYTGMAHSVKPVGQSFAQASFIQGGYFPGADHSLI